MNSFLRKHFKGNELARALRKQTIVECDEGIAKRLAHACKCVILKPDQNIITEGDATDAVFFILQGSVEVTIKGARIATRTAGQHFGEMASLLSSRRTASVVAREETVCAKVNRKDFHRIADDNPILWRHLAGELANRLHQRRNLIREPNLSPVIFVGSSGTQKDVAEELRKGLIGLGAEVQVWSDPGVFAPSDTFIETLTTSAARADFAILVLGRDDVVRSQGRTQFAPRDNVIFEAGLFIGAISRQRTFLVRPKHSHIKILTDLAGVSLLHYKKAKGNVDVSAACKTISATVRKMRVR